MRKIGWLIGGCMFLCACSEPITPEKYFKNEAAAHAFEACKSHFAIPTKYFPFPQKGNWNVNAGEVSMSWNGTAKIPANDYSKDRLSAFCNINRITGKGQATLNAQDIGDFQVAPF